MLISFVLLVMENIVAPNKKSSIHTHDWILQKENNVTPESKHDTLVMKRLH